jgi:hypothetical protein
VFETEHLALEINGNATQNNYIRLYSGDTTGQTWDNTNKFYGDITNTDDIFSNGFISIVINGNTYYMPIYSGTNTTQCCSNLVGTQATTATNSFNFVGFALIKVNNTMFRYAPIYTII